MGTGPAGDRGVGRVPVLSHAPVLVSVKWLGGVFDLLGRVLGGYKLGTWL